MPTEGPGPTDETSSTGNPLLDALGFTRQQLAFLKGLAENPTQTIVGFVLAWFVARIIGVVRWFINGLFTLVDETVNAVLVVFASLRYASVTGFGSIANAVLTMHVTIVETVTGLGIAAFPASVAAFGIEVFVLLTAADAVIRIIGVEALSSVPVVGSITSVLGEIYEIIKANIFRALRVILG